MVFVVGRSFVSYLNLYIVSNDTQHCMFLSPNAQRLSFKHFLHFCYIFVSSNLNSIKDFILLDNDKTNTVHINQVVSVVIVILQSHHKVYI